MIGIWYVVVTVNELYIAARQNNVLNYVTVYTACVGRVWTLQHSSRLHHLKPKWTYFRNMLCSLWGLTNCTNVIVFVFLSFSL
jgi:hypothetical protein